MNVDQIVIPDKVKHNDDGFKYFIGYKEDDIVKSLCIILCQMSEYIKYVEKGGKNVSFMIREDSVLIKDEKNWNKIKKALNIKFSSMPVYDKKYIKAKVREFNGVIKTKDDELPRAGVHYACMVCITINSVMRMEKKNYPQVYLDKCKYKIKKTNI